MITYLLVGLVIGIAALLAFSVISSRFHWGKADLAADEVATHIEQFLAGTGKEWDWDDFTSVPIRNPDLDKIRIRCLHLDEEFPPAVAGAYCSPEGEVVLQSFANELRTKTS